MSVLVILSTADHRIFRNSRLKEIPAGSCGRTVMSRNQHITGKINTGCTHRRFTGTFRISGENKGIISVGQFDGYRVFIAVIRIDRCRRQNLKTSGSERKFRSNRRMLHCKSLIRNCLDKRLIQLAVMFIIAGDYIFYIESTQASDQPCHMVAVIMRRNQIIDRGNILLLQIGNYKT